MFLALAVSLIAFSNASPASAAPAYLNQTITDVGTGLQLSANASDVYTVAPSDSIYHQWAVEGDGGQIINNGLHKCLSSNYGDNTSGDVYTVACNDATTYQHWHIYNTAYGQEIVNVGTGWCLSSNFGDGSSGTVYTVRCNGLTIYQSWKLVNLGG
jgi:hypothetical protein